MKKVEARKMVGSEQSNSLDAQKSNCKHIAFEQRKQHIVQGKHPFLNTNTIFWAQAHLLEEMVGKEWKRKQTGEVMLRSW